MTPTELSQSYKDHLRQREQTTTAALERCGYSTLVIDSGSPTTYFADDQDAPFRTTPHFAHWCPAEGPHHLLVIRPGAKPRLVFYAPKDYWYEQKGVDKSFWTDGFDIVEVGSQAAAWQAVGPLARAAYIGPDTGKALTAGVAAKDLNPGLLTSLLDWERAYKSDYEIACLAQATASAARGHLAARRAFLHGATELEIHHAYVQAVGCTDERLPYGSIVALNEKGAILHYEGKRHIGNGKVLLIDAGAKHLGYGSDITRTHTAEGADPVFVELVSEMNRLQLELCAMVRPDMPFFELHHAAHLKIAAVLLNHGILRAESPEATVTKGYTRPFFPHGLGHLLGVQTHDVGGRQGTSEGSPALPPPEHPTLRTTRHIESRMVFTVEPGLYFIPMLLEPFRSGPHAHAFDWLLIDRLVPSGGIRIEDNVVVQTEGIRNLTREHLPD